MQRLKSIILIVVFLLSISSQAASPKKGVGTWYFNSAAITETALNDVGVSWFYTWEPKNYWFATPPGKQYVPMIWGTKHIGATYFEQAKATGTNILLGFNEPDIQEQSNITPAQAIDLWPLFEATGMRLGSPAQAHDPSVPGSWLEQFLAGNGTYTPHVDFIAVHWYGSNFNADTSVLELRNFLQRVYDKYQKPIWLTEYGLAIYWPAYSDASINVMAEFATKSVPMLESLEFVERYAWFALPPWSYDGTTHSRMSLYNLDGSPTAVGAAYSVDEIIPVDPTQPNENLIQDGGFESSPSAWQDWGNSTVSSASPLSGTYALELASGAGGRGYSVSSAIAPQSYVLSGWGRFANTATGTAYIGVKGETSAGTPFEHALTFTDTTYRQKTLTFTAAENVSWMTVYVWKGANTGLFFADDISLTAVETTANSPSSVTPNEKQSGSAAVNSLPTINITYPEHKKTYRLGSVFTISADAFDSDGSVSKVEFFVNRVKIGEDNSPPYHFNWSGMRSGDYSLTAKVTDNAGGETISSEVIVYVRKKGILSVGK